VSDRGTPSIGAKRLRRFATGVAFEAIPAVPHAMPTGSFAVIADFLIVDGRQAGTKSTDSWIPFYEQTTIRSGRKSGL
jgi:hypothetical protein